MLGKCCLGVSNKASEKVILQMYPKEHEELSSRGRELEPVHHKCTNRFPSIQPKKVTPNQQSTEDSRTVKTVCMIL